MEGDKQVRKIDTSAEAVEMVVHFLSEKEYYYAPATLRALAAERDTLLAALTWYAADYDYERGYSHWDSGAKARAALASIKGTAP
jgi:hypothetical protein